MSHNYRLILPFMALMILIGGVLSGCTSAAEHESEHDVAMAALADMPMDVQQAPVTVQQAYQFAVANPEVLKEIPCYCGCGAMGHTSNYACYVAGTTAEGVITYDPHALGCSICVDITQDTIRLLKQGQAVSEIRLYIDTTYAKFGSSNMPSE